MGVHGVGIVSASLFNCALLRSSKNRGNYQKAFFSKKNGLLCKMGAHTPLVSTKWVRAPGGPYFHNS